MRYNRYFTCVFAVLLFTVSSVNAGNGISFVYPENNSQWQSPETRLTIGFQEQVPSNISIQVEGSLSGSVALSRYINSDRTRLVLTPEEAFRHGETITVNLNWRQNSVVWSFDIRPVDPPTFPEHEEGSTLSEFNTVPSGNNVFSSGVTVPSDFPELTINTSGSPGEGHYFLGSLNGNDVTSSSYLVIADNDGEPVFYWHWNKGIFCVEVQPTDDLTFATRLPGNVITWLVMDDTYSFQDSFKVIGYPTDIHDLTMRDNGNALLIGVDTRYVDMSQVVPGGNPNALVKGLLIQEQDQNHQPVFQWSSFDHFEITDAAHFVDLTAPYIDYVHCNSVQEDTDGNILVSCLAMCQCVKVDQNNGDVLWRFGGLDADSSWFTLQGDPLGGFSTQHDFSSSGENLYTVFDNGRFHNPQVSRGLEYQLDMNDMTATLVWSYQEPGLYGSHQGSVQHIPGGNYIVGWGDVVGTTTFSDVTEVSPDGIEIHSMRFTDPALESYKAYKDQWEGQALVPYLITEINSSGTAAVLTYNVFGNNQYEQYRIWKGTSPSQLAPLLLTPERQATIWAVPAGWNYFAVSALDSNQVETGLSNTDSVFVNWTGINSQVGIAAPSVRVFPNPACESVNVELNSTVTGIVSIEVFDLSGRIVLKETDILPVRGETICTFSTCKLPSGLYSVRVSGMFPETVGMLVVLK